jgi:hypothetical protein
MRGDAWGIPEKVSDPSFGDDFYRGKRSEQSLHKTG